ncbi:MAG: gluconate 2-dehydrogenase subunit 3 family protein [Chitinophagaceae bacterium]
MPVNRRKAVKNILLVSGSIISLPFWMTACSSEDTTTHLSSFSPGEQKLLASIADTIIPAGNPIAVGSIGALSMEVDKFLQKIIDNCYEKAVQDNVKRQLKALDTTATTTYSKSFTACHQEQREDLLLKFSVAENKDEKDFFTLMKTETIRGFTTSKKIMEDFHHYKVVPGHYYGCVDLNS